MCHFDGDLLHRWASPFDLISHVLADSVCPATHIFKSSLASLLQGYLFFLLFFHFFWLLAALLVSSLARRTFRESSCCWPADVSLGSSTAFAQQHTMKYQMLSRLADVGLSAFCFRQIVFCCFLCSVFIVLLLNQPSSLNDDVSTDLPPSRTTTALVDAKIQQLERQKLLHEKCRDLKKLAKANRQRRKVGATQVRLIIEDRHRVVYCDVPKVKIPIKTISSKCRT